MCLIVYSPTGALLERDVFECARTINGDGVGVMSSHGIRKFLGKNADAGAWEYIEYLATLGAPHGIHFRWATHGAVTRANCHPFRAPDSDAFVMHNGMIGLTAYRATGDRSDTALFVESYMRGAPRPQACHYRNYYRDIEADIGIENTLLVFHTSTGQFTICNEDSGEWIDEHWYSNTYSLPPRMSWDSWISMLKTDPPPAGVLHQDPLDGFDEWMRQERLFRDDPQCERWWRKAEEDPNIMED
jgi:hypothetical protein